MIVLKEYIGIRFKSEINVSKLFSVHYFEYPVNFSYAGEKHDFWEMVYADKGDIQVSRDNNSYTLKQGEIIFHKPNEWHTISAFSDSAPNVAIVAFECKSEAMAFFEDKILAVGQEQKAIISKIISEYTGGFSTPLDNPYTKNLTRKKVQRFGAEQLIKQYISELLISFLRRNTAPIQKSAINMNRDNLMFEMIENYMLDRIYESISIEDLVKFSGSNKTTLTTLFKDCSGLAPIEYFLAMKIDLAKQYLREDNHNISQIAEILGYSSIHYFSRQFKKISGMTPSEYALSIQAIIKEA